MKNDNTDNDKNEKTKRIIIYIIIIIIIILALLTSCSCTSKFFGKIGDNNLNQGEHDLNDNTNDLEKVYNQELTFDSDNLEISLNDNKYKLGFTYKNINPQEFSCSTSDASIATCYVSNGYVVINPLAVGRVIVTLQATTNGKIYLATANVTVTDTDKYIELTSTSGTLNIAYGKTKNVGYRLVGISGKVTVTSSDDSIATATAQNGVLKITAKTTGVVTITISVNYNGIIYEKSYTLTVIKNQNSSSGNSNNNKPNTPSENPSKPSDTPNNDNQKLNDDTSLKLLTVDGISILDNKFIEVSSSSIYFSATPTASTSVIIYNNQEYKSLKDLFLSLSPGVNIVNFQVKAESGRIQDYSVIIYRTSSSSSGGSGSSSSNAILTIEPRITCYLEINECQIEYNVINNGSYNGSETIGNININVPKLDSSNFSHTTPGLIVINNYADIMTLNETATLTISSSKYGTATSQITFDVKDYDLYPELTKQEGNTYIKYVDILEDGSSKDVISLYTNFFKDNGFEPTLIEKSSSGLLICADKNKKMCIKIYSDSNKIEIDYNLTTNESSPSTLPISIKGKEIGDVVLEITGKIYGKDLPDSKVIIKAEEVAIVNIHSNGGQFSIFGKIDEVYSYKLSSKNNRELDLSTIDKPFRLSRDKCYYNQLKGYSTSKNSNLIEYGPNAIIKNITGTLDLYAIYDEDEHTDLKEVLTQTLWLDEISLFGKYDKEDKDGTLIRDDVVPKDIPNLIYPGASGHYQAILRNPNGYNISVTGIKLKEVTTICIEEKKCLNMGYIIRRTTSKPENKYYYYYIQPEGDKQFNSLNYRLLHQELNSKITIPLEEESFEIPKGKEVYLDIFWKWVEYDSKSDELDTKIGIKAAELAKEDLNIYQVAIGLDFYVEKDINCQ